jgi:DNA topoisomerase-1
MKLVIVESPTKAKTISRFLPRDFKVESSYGHIRDLPKSKLGIDVEKNFTPNYVILPKAQKKIASLKTETKKANTVILATDEDREGEAIAWHIVETLDLDETKDKKAKTKKNIERIVFHEITKKAIEEALKNPRGINMNLVDAQQARRVLDRLVGYELSPFLWKKIKRGLSAGRVQSAAMRLIAEREQEIKNFKSEEYWTITASLLKIKNERNKFEAILIKKGGKVIPKLGIKSKIEADKILKDLKKAEYEIADIRKREVKRIPSPPFTTSTLQQEANSRFRFSAKQTMMVAQQLYEGISINGSQTGLITYMRTDSVNLSSESAVAAKKLIEKKIGKEYALQTPRFYKTKSKSAQEAHEAIRPTMPEKTPDELKKYLNPNQLKLYTLIWQRMIASQMQPAVFEATSADILAQQNHNNNSLSYTLRANGFVVKFDGFLKIYEGKTNIKENILPELSKNEKLKLIKLTPSQKFTQPPARYSEATLVKTLEENGIGRPSTYAPIISTIQERGYVEKDENRRFFPTEIGIMVNNLLVKHFPKVVDIKFTAGMEKNLDEIAAGKIKWQPVIKEFYEPFKENLNKKTKEVKKEDLMRIDRKCPECGSQMVVKFGRFGKFYACSKYPECKHTEATEEEKKIQEENSGEFCEKCGAPMSVKRGKYGMFLGCSNYPECKNIKKIQRAIGVKCPKCDDGDILERKTKRGKIFYGCSRWPKCGHSSWERPKEKLKENTE